MALLLDTHALIWFITDDANLPGRVRRSISDVNNRCFVSIVSLWEIAVKKSLGKLQLDMTIGQLSKVIARSGIGILQISPTHISWLSMLEFHHRDPFDRLIISQAIVEGHKIVSKDAHFPKYTPDVMW